MNWYAKHKKLVYLSLMSVILMLLGIAVVGWAVDKLQGDKAVIEDIDRHFAALGRKKAEGEARPHVDKSPANDISLHSNTASPSKKRSSTRTLGRKGKKTPSSVPAPLAKVNMPWPGIEEAAPATYTIEKSLFENAKSNVAPFIQGVRSVLTAEDGKPFGFRLFGISDKSALFALGLRNGDILTSVNGYQLDSIDQALLAAATLKTSGRFRVDVIRNGSLLSLYYRVI